MESCPGPGSGVHHLHCVTRVPRLVGRFNLQALIWFWMLRQLQLISRPLSSYAKLQVLAFRFFNFSGS